MSVKKTVVGGTLSVLGSLMLLLSAFLKLKGGPQLDEGMAHVQEIGFGSIIGRN